MDSAIASFAPAVGPGTVILPLLNGMRHLEILDDRFGPDRVLGGQCLIAATLNEQGEIVHLTDAHAISRELGQFVQTRNRRLVGTGKPRKPL